MRVKFYAWFLLTFITFAFVHTSTAGGYLLQHHTKWCTAHTMLATIEDCENAKKSLDPNAAAVRSDNDPDAPKGCSRFEGKWFFNNHDKGEVDGVSEPICKARGGEPTETVFYTHIRALHVFIVSTGYVTTTLLTRCQCLIMLSTRSPMVLP